MKVVFLDIDGVLNSAKTNFHRIDPELVSHLNWLLDQSGAKVVVSSTWRMFVTMPDELIRAGLDRERLAPDWRTPDATFVQRGSEVVIADERGHEIQDWLTRHEECVGFVILDDANDMAHLVDRLVQTDHMVGLTMADARRALEMLA